MNSPPSSSEGGMADFDLLHPGVQRWVWANGWTSLRDAQQRAIRPILAGERDLIIAAATAAGKTEAAFLPILTKIANAGEESALAIYISPLKALINDQWGRLQELCESLEIPVIPWHGDINANKKQRFLKHPRGVLLITPESLEAMFVRRGSAVRQLFSETTHIVVDELHAFIGSDRGKQMQSLLQRIEQAAEHRIPRIGLSATLGDMKLAAEYLRPGAGETIEMIISVSTGQEIQIQARGYVVPAHIEADTVEEAELRNASADESIADHLYKTMLGKNNLIFPNSRNRVEFYTDALRRRCEADARPVEFWPHHGSLSRSIREDTERALKTGGRPATAICTNTLELGIDIGAVTSVAQIGPGPSVASLRQRLGRSGRRPGEPAILRAYAIEDELTSKSDFSDRLREGLIQSIAMIQLLLRGWVEPPNAKGLHLSTLVQQVLSVIAERGGATAFQLQNTLVVNGAFSGLPQADMAELLRSLAANDLIVQDPTGLLLLGQTGERFVASYDFYAAFASEEEWQILCSGQVMGTLPISSPVFKEMRIIFAGRRWQITEVEDEARILSVTPDPGGNAPRFSGSGTSVHGMVRREMRAILQDTEPVRYLDRVAARLLAEARKQYRMLGLDQQTVLQSGDSYSLFTWTGDPTNDALVLLLRGLGVEHLESEGLYVSVGKCDRDRLLDALSDIAQLHVADLESLLTDVFNMRRGKWDWALPDSLLRKSFVSAAISFGDARQAAAGLLTSERMHAP